MSLKPKFYLPVVLPPFKDQGNPPGYYAAMKEDLETEITADAGEGSLSITITNSDQLHPGDQFDQPVPFSTVFAPTAGFVSFYPGSEVVPTPLQQTFEPPPGINANDVGTLVIRVWIRNLVDFLKPASSDEPRANRIALGWLAPSTVQAAFAAEITKLKTKVLKRAWEEADGTADEPDRTDLETAFLQRFMTGQAEVFVSAGAVLGSAVSTSPHVSQVILETFFQSPDQNQASQFLEVDTFIGNALDGLSADAKALFDHHPLLEALNVDIGIHFQSKFLIWDNSTFTYVPFADADVRLMKVGAGELARTTTAANGLIDLTLSPTAQLKKNDLIYFEYATFNKQFGARTFAEDIRTDSHRAGIYLNPSHENTHEYRAKHEIFPKYISFNEQMATNIEEKFEKDRGNFIEGETTTGTLNVATGKLLRDFEAFEKFYKAGSLPAANTTFNVLVEGDSWFNYPLDLDGDIYRHLDDMLRKNRKPGITYNSIPLQHYGDRSDQMFGLDPQGELTQWHFLEDILSEYKIDLIVCSGGGNDFAEPGIGNDTKLLPYKDCFTDGYFDPYKAANELHPLQLASAQRLMRKSFAALLKNHRWHFYLRGDNIANQLNKDQVFTDLNSKLLALPEIQADEKAFGEPRLAWQQPYMEGIGTQVIANFPERFTLPNPNGDDYDKLLTSVFDAAWYEERFDSVIANLKTLLDCAKVLNIPVISHSYGYPFFNEEPTTYLGWGDPLTGPWFGPRFREAQVFDRRIQRICLKVILDNYLGSVLYPLQQNYPLFDFVDVRNTNSKVERWRDEMHLTKHGFKEIAEAIYDKVKARFPAFFE